MESLTRIHLDIDNRVQSIRSQHPEWLCRRGCDRCCHRLAEIPRLTQAEWELLQQGMATLPAELFEEISRNIAALAEQPSRPLVCPLLDRDASACRVYAYRPVACRTYGFYVQRDKGLYCKDIETQVDDGRLADVVWGNQDAIDRRLRELGETRDLSEWFMTGSHLSGSEHQWMTANQNAHS